VPRGRARCRSDLNTRALGAEHQERQLSADQKPKAVIAALAANLGIAVLKFAAFAITGSASLLAEGVHSVVDSGNQGLLLLGGRRARQDADAQHQFGYGSVRYVYAFLVALVIFTAGGLFALYEGIEKVRRPHHLDSAIVAIVVLLGAIVLEGFSLRTAVHEAAPHKGSASWVQFIRNAKVPELPVVLLEDSAALVGLVLALLGVGLTMITGDPIWDGLGTVAIGVLLVSVAVILVVETRSLLVGESATPQTQSTVEAALLGRGDHGVVTGAAAGAADVERVIHLRTLYLGPEELLVAAKLAMPAAADLRAVAAAIDAAEARVRAAVPTVTLMYLEPDIDRGDTGRASSEI
jgi:cation diffusion facilitator family transporter